MALKYILKQVREIEDSRDLYKNQGCPIKVEVVGDNYFELKAEICGAPGTPYEGGTFKTDLKIPQEYPFKPPTVYLLTKIWHPDFMHDIFNINVGYTWTPSMTLNSSLISLQALLSTPRPDCPQNAMGKQYTKHPDMFEKTAKHWTHIYAGGSNRQPELEDKCTKLMAMGFEEDIARLTLSSKNWNVEQAVAKLIRS